MTILAKILIIALEIFGGSIVAIGLIALFICFCLIEF